MIASAIEFLLCKRIASILFCLALKCLLSHGTMFCYHGNDVNSLTALQNETCLTKELHIPKQLLPNDQQTSAAPMELQDGTGSFETTNELRKSVVPLCFIFRYISTYIYASGVTQQSVHIEFGCDLGHLCARRDLNKVYHNVTRQNSQLYCCRGNNCNNVDRLPHLAAENRICYHGTNNHSDNPTAEVKPCTQPDVSCARKTTFLSDGKIEDYFCDNSNSCYEQMSSGAYRSCANTTSNNITQELCCCNKNNCFMPRWPLTSGNPSANNSSVLINRDAPYDAPMGATIDEPEGSKSSPALVTGLVCVIIIMASIAGGIILFTACKQRKRRLRRDPNVIMQYERLSVSEADIEDAVVL